jgi:2-methylcitrate dehydratase PrpD
LGERFETLRISLKLYSCVSTNHTSLDAIRRMQERHPFGPDDVDAITVRCSKATLEHAGWPYKPEGMTAAQLNLSYCLATLLLTGDCFVEQFSETLLANPARLALAAKVPRRRRPRDHGARVEIPAHGASSRVRLKDGVELARNRGGAEGSERDFPSRDVVAEKFLKLSGRKLSHSQAELIIDLVLGLDRLEDVSPLIRALAV